MSDQWNKKLESDRTTDLLITHRIILDSVLPKTYFEHFLLFHNAATILLSKMWSNYAQNARNILRQFVLDYKALYRSHRVTTNVHSLLHIVDDYENYGDLNTICFQFENYLYRLKKSVVSSAEASSAKYRKMVSVILQTTTRYIRPREVPYALKDAINRELDEWVREGIIILVDKSDWDLPIVPITKSNNKIRICGDYKVAVNKQLVSDHHPIPSSSPFNVVYKTFNTE